MKELSTKLRLTPKTKQLFPADLAFPQELQFRRKLTHTFARWSSETSTTLNSTSSLLLLHETLFPPITEKATKSRRQLHVTSQYSQLTFFTFHTKFLPVLSEILESIVWFAAPFKLHTQKKHKSWKVKVAKVWRFRLAFYHCWVLQGCSLFLIIKVPGLCTKY